MHLGFPPEDLAGGAKYVYYLANELAMLGNKVTVFTYKAEETSNAMESDYPLKENVTVERLNYRHLPVFREKFLVGLNHRLSKGFDLVIGFQSLYLTTTLALRHCRRKSIPYACTTFDLGVFSSALTEKIRGRLQLSEVFKHMVFGTVISEKSRAVFAKKFPEFSDMIFTITPGIDFNVFNAEKVNRNEAAEELALDRKSRHLLFVGRIAPEKGINYLFEAFEIVKQKNPDVKLVVVGEGNDHFVENLKGQLEHRNLRESTVFLTMLSQQELASLYGCCDLTVLPSTTMAEGFGMVLLESLAMGTPVVTTRIAGAAYIVEGNPSFGSVVKEADSVELANAIEKELKRKKKVDLKALKNFSWKEIARQYQKLIEGKR